MNIENEKTQLSATYFNRLAIAIFAVAGLGPMVAFFNAADLNELRFLAIFFLDHGRWV